VTRVCLLPGAPKRRGDSNSASPQPVRQSYAGACQPHLRQLGSRKYSERRFWIPSSPGKQRSLPRTGDAQPSPSRRARHTARKPSDRPLPPTRFSATWANVGACVPNPEASRPNCVLVASAVRPAGLAGPGAWGAGPPPAGCPRFSCPLCALVPSLPPPLDVGAEGLGLRTSSYRKRPLCGPSVPPSLGNSTAGGGVARSP